MIARRAFLTGLSAAGVITTAPAIASEPQSEIILWFRLWESIYRKFGHHDWSDDDADRLTEQLSKIEDQMEPLLPTTVVEFAAKLVVATSYGDFTLEGRGGGPLHDAKALLGSWRDKPLESLPCAG